MATTTRSKETTTIRVTVAARDALQEIAREEQQTVGEVVDGLVEAKRQEKYWADFKVAVDRLKADPEAWAEYQAESDLWETASLMDFKAYAEEHDL